MSAKQLLVVDGPHEQHWVRFLRQALKPLGELHVGTEDNALELVARQPFDIVVVDSTAIREAHRLVAALRERRPDLRVIVATASPQWTDARAVFQSGAVEYIEKTLGADDVREVVACVLARPPRPSPQPARASKVVPMPRITVLLADNHAEFRTARQEFLEDEGYFVLTATSPAEARKYLDSGLIDLAILDIRLNDDTDERDESGLTLAKEVALSVPKIILTSFPRFEYVRDVLRPSVSGLPAVVDFIAKEEGPEPMLKAVERVLRSRAVFIVHGHDLAAKETVARFIGQLGLQAVILNELPGGGRTIIEKFEQSAANVGFAVVLLTPDDIGAARSTPADLRDRARQNVIFELGYFFGKLGRSRVGVLSKGVETPSDYVGVEYLPMDEAGAWKLPLARAIRYSGINIDLNRAL